MNAHIVLGIIVVITYSAAFLIGAGALWKVRDDSYVYALTFASTTASLAFCFKYAGYIASAEYVYVHGAYMWAALHILHGGILAGFHVARFRGEI